MPNAPPLTPSLVLFGLIVLAGLVAMLAAWVWAIVWLATGHRLLPDGTPRRVPWGPFSIVAVVLLYFGVSIAIGLFYSYETGRGRFSRGTAAAAAAKLPVPDAVKQAAPTGRPNAASSMPARDQLLLMSCINAALLVLVPTLLRLTSSARLEDLGLTARGLLLNFARGVIACLLLAPIVYMLMIPLSRVTTPHPHPLLTMLREDPTGQVAVLAVVGAVILAPAAEELLFRAVLLGWLLKVSRAAGAGKHEFLGDGWAEPVMVADEPGSASNPYSFDEHGQPVAVVPASFTTEDRPRSFWLRVAPNVLTSIIFAGLHAAQWPAPVPLFILSLGLGLLYERTGTLWAPFALHACFNGISTGMLLLAIYCGVPLPKAEPVGPAVEAVAAPEMVHLHARCIATQQNKGDF